MKAIINNLLYDTDKSTLLHHNDLTGVSIYLTKNKRLFITEYGDAQITNTNIDECKKYLGLVNPDKYIELCGQVEEA